MTKKCKVNANVDLQIAADRQALFEQAATNVVDIYRQAGAKFSLALSGGSTPKGLYQLLASPQWKDKIGWTKTELFWGDERCVSHDSPDSNYHMTKEALLDKIAIPDKNVHPYEEQDTDPVASARDYEEVLRQVFGAGIPRFNLILLGLGPEGHTASIFPDSPAITEKQHMVLSYFVDEAHGKRITFTLPLINNADYVMFLVAGADKKEILADILSGKAANLPASLVKPQGKVIWLVDEAAASGLDLSQFDACPDGDNKWLDLSHLEQACGKEAAQEVLVSFIEELAHLTKKLVDTHASGDIDNLRVVAHELKGMAASVAATELMHNAAAVEQAARTGDKATVEANYQNLLPTLDETKRYAEKQMS